MIKVDYDSKKKKAIISGDLFSEIREHFSVPNPAAKYNRSFYIPKRLYPISTTGHFDIGLMGDITKYVKSKNASIDIVFSEEAGNVLKPSLDKTLIERLSFPLRYYQKEAIQKCMENGRGVALMGTGAGKTLTIATLIENFYLHSKDVKKFKCLLLVPDIGLVTQTYDDLVSYNVSFSFTQWTGSIKPDISVNVIIANSGIILNRISVNKWLNDVDLLIVDEVHKLGAGNKITKLLDAFKTNNRFGFTGTLPDDQVDKWSVLGKIGPVLIEKSSHELREENFLTNVHVNMLNLNYITQPPVVVSTGNTTDDYYNELLFIQNNSFRNSVIESTCKNFNNNVLILVNAINHGQTLYDILTKKLPQKQVFFIRGEVEVEDRNAVKSIMENHDNVVCIAISSIFSTGVNIKNIHMILFAAGGKSFVRTVQSIGRGLRLNENKQQLRIIDICDNLKYGKEHSDKRKEIYNNEKINYTIHSIKET
jgi:superfamily II DNA or RNA helicase